MYVRYDQRIGRRHTGQQTDQQREQTMAGDHGGKFRGSCLALRVRLARCSDRQGAESVADPSQRRWQAKQPRPMAWQKCEPAQGRRGVGPLAAVVRGRRTKNPTH